MEVMPVSTTSTDDLAMESTDAQANSNGRQQVEMHEDEYGDKPKENRREREDPNALVQLELMRLCVENRWDAR